MVNKVNDFLVNNSTCTVATSSNDIPAAATVDYSMVNNNLVFSSACDTVKAQNLAVNNQACVTVHDPVQSCACTVEGTTVTPTQDEIDTYNQNYCTRHNMSASDIPDRNYYKLVPDRVHYNDYSDGDYTAETYDY